MAHAKAGPATEIDIVDDEDRVIGTATRDGLPARGLNFRVAHVFVFDHHDCLVLGKLGTERTNQPGRWGSSVAAHLWAGESYEEAARRRLLEELDVDTPVALVDKIALPEGAAIKFVGLYKARATDAHILEPQHIAALRTVTWSDLLAELDQAPDRFTPTFRALVSAFKAAQPRT